MKLFRLADRLSFGPRTIGCTRFSYKLTSPGFIVFDVVVRATGCASGSPHLHTALFPFLFFSFLFLGGGLWAGFGPGMGGSCSVIRGGDRLDTWHGGGGEAGMCCVVLCFRWWWWEAQKSYGRGGRPVGEGCDGDAVVGSCDTFPCRREAYVVFTDEQETNPGAWDRRATTLFPLPLIPLCVILACEFQRGGGGYR
jgi:hypothetical protein